MVPVSPHEEMLRFKWGQEAARPIKGTQELLESSRRSGQDLQKEILGVKLYQLQEEEDTVSVGYQRESMKQKSLPQPDCSSNLDKSFLFHPLA